MAESGSITWPSAAEPLWRLDWALADAPDQEGIVVRNVSYRNRQVFHKASLPSLRVQYDGPCGPYKDPLNFNNARPTTRCPAQRVCVYSYVSNGLRALALDSYHTIGNYRLTHRWVFWEHGHVLPRLFSAGLQCNYNHRHHAYWRFDFDIGGSANDLLLEFNSYAPDSGWGRGWTAFGTETSAVKYPPSNRSWAVLDKGSGSGYHIFPEATDGVADAFSNRDLWALRYQGGEDLNGRQGTAFSDALAPYVNGEPMDGQDVVAWYVGHLSHEAAHGGDEWHSTGPTLTPFNWS
jgi:hypothetical protein